VKGVVDTGATPVGGAGIESGARSRRGKCTIQDDKMKTWIPKNRKELKKHLSDPCSRMYTSSCSPPSHQPAQASSSGSSPLAFTPLPT